MYVHVQYKSALATLSELQPRFQPRHNGKTRNSNKLVARSRLSLDTIYMDMARILSLVGFCEWRACGLKWWYDLVMEKCLVDCWYQSKLDASIPCTLISPGVRRKILTDDLSVSVNLVIFHPIWRSMDLPIHSLLDPSMSFNDLSFD